MSDEPMSKDEVTARLRAALLAVPEAQETNRAEAGLTTLSFVSRKHPNRNVWVDTDLAGRLVIDLEDFQDDREWDNAVARVAPVDESSAVSVIAAWLGGQALDAASPSRRKNSGAAPLRSVALGERGEQRHQRRQAATA